MTRDEIMSMDEDALRLKVAKALGWVFPYEETQYVTHEMAIDAGDRELEGEIYAVVQFGGDGEPPDWPRDIAAAWELFEKIQVSPFVFIKKVKLPSDSRVLYQVFIADEQNPIEVIDLVAPMAICRAWLMWKEGA